MTVVDVLTQRLESEQETCKRQLESISDLRLQIMAFQGARVRFAIVCARQQQLTLVLQPRVALQRARVLDFVKKCRSRMLLMSGQFFLVFLFFFCILFCLVSVL